MATSNKGKDSSAAEPQGNTPSARSAMMKYRKPLTISAIVAGGALALGAAFTGGIAVAQHERPHFGNEAMGAPQFGERGEQVERSNRGEQAERGEHRGHGPRGDANQQRPDGPREQRPMGGQSENGNAPATSDEQTPTP